MKFYKVRSITLLMLTLTFSICSAQDAATTVETKEDEKPSVKPTESDWGVVLNVTGLIDQIGLSNFQDSITQNSILVKHYLTDNTVLRAGFGVNMRNKKTSTVETLEIDEQVISTDSIFSQSAYSFSIGIEKHLGSNRRLDPYIGAQATLGFIGKTKIDVDTEISEATGDNSINRDYTLDGGTMIGVHAVGGFNYFIAEQFSLGAEYLLGLTSIKRGGNYSDITVITPAAGNSSSTVEKGEISTRTNYVNLSGNAVITLSYFF